MAANNYIRLRKANWEDFSDPDIKDIIQQLKNASYDPWIWSFKLNQESPDALAEARVAFTAEFNGETTPIVLYVIGEAANEDKAAGTGAQAVTIYGIDADGNPAQEEVTMHGTPNTQIASTTLWKRFIGAMVTTAGSGLVNAGIILITDTGQGNTYGTIAAGENCTIGTRVYVPTNYNAFIGHICAACTAAADAEAELLFGNGIIIEPLYLTNPDPLNKDSYFIRGEERMINAHPVHYIIEGANTRYISFKHCSKTADANTTATIHMKVIMYGTTNTLRGLGT